MKTHRSKYEVKSRDAKDFIHYQLCASWKEVRAVIEYAPIHEVTILAVLDREKWTNIPHSLWGESKEPEL